MIDPACDYPAAHSMDTVWYAVDCHGHVAVFESGETGAVPLDSCEEPVWGLPVVGRWYQQCTFEPLPDSSLHRPAHAPIEGRTPADRLLFFADRAPLSTLTELTLEEVAASEGVAFIARGLTPGQWHRLHQDGLCRSCRPWSDTDPLPPEDDEEPVVQSPAAAWAYRYRHLTDSWVSGPYGRLSSPSRPLRVEQLDPEVRQRVGEIRLNLSFADSPRVHPAEHQPCDSWNPCWLAPDGRIRPVPGLEEDYAGEFQEQMHLIGGRGYPMEPPIELPKPPPPKPWWKRLFGGGK